MEQRSRAISSLALTAALVHLSRMPVLTSSRQEKFAQLCGSGLNNSEAYRRLSGKERNADVRAAQLMAQPGVRERVAEIKEQNAQRAQMSRDELMAFYAACLRTPADRVPPGSSVIQAYEETPEGGRKIRIVDKAAAGAALARMCGWNEPEPGGSTGGNTLTIYLQELRARRLEPSAFRVVGESAPMIGLETAVPKSVGNGENAASESKPCR